MFIYIAISFHSQQEQQSNNNVKYTIKFDLVIYYHSFVIQKKKKKREHKNASYADTCIRVKLCKEEVIDLNLF